MINDTKQTSTSPLTPHLSEDQINDALIGELSERVSEHLAACVLCQAEVEPFQASIATFNQATAAWSEAKSNTLNRDLSNFRPSRRFTPAAIWSFASAVVVAAAVVLSPSLHHSSASTSIIAHGGLIANNSAASRADEIAADNAMLGAINSELQPAAPPEALLESASETPHIRARRMHQEND